MSRVANVGFAAGCNAAARQLGPVPWIAFVNPNVQLDQPLSRLARQVRDFGCDSCGGAEVVKLRSPDAISCRPASDPESGISTCIIGSRVYSLARRDFGAQPELVGRVGGALTVISRENFLLLGGFDERFELYYDDVDLCARAGVLAGCWFTPQLGLPMSEGSARRPRTGRRTSPFASVEFATCANTSEPVQR